MYQLTTIITAIMFSEIPRRPLILFIGVCHKLYFCGIELSSINLLKFLCWKFWVGGGGVLPIRHFPWSLATCHVEVKNGGLRKKPCHFLQKRKYYVEPQEACFAKMMFFIFMTKWYIMIRMKKGHFVLSIAFLFYW